MAPEAASQGLLSRDEFVACIAWGLAAAMRFAANERVRHPSTWQSVCCSEPATDMPCETSEVNTMFGTGEEDQRSSLHIL